MESQSADTVVQMPLVASTFSSGVFLSSQLQVCNHFDYHYECHLPADVSKRCTYREGYSAYIRDKSLYNGMAGFREPRIDSAIFRILHLP